MIIFIIIGDATDLMIMGGVSLNLFLDSKITESSKNLGIR